MVGLTLSLAKHCLIWLGERRANLVNDVNFGILGDQAAYKMN